MEGLNTPGLDSPIVQSPEHVAFPFGGLGEIDDYTTVGRASHRIHISRKGAHWEWAHLLRAVTGWTVVSSGMLDGGLYKDHEAAAEYLVKQARGADGDGFDRLSRDAYFQVGTVAHIRREEDPGIGYCGKKGGAPAVFSTLEPKHAEQHCITCDRAYRAEHYGRTPVTH